MDIQTLDALDQKIARLLGKLTELQEENRRVAGELSTLRADQVQAQKDLEEARKRCEALEENQRDPQKEELIRTRISALLEKLEAA